ncbi:hypothetical protein PGT21_028401 [Puccinia graminis f. sp. tritici]|uniref:Uncharacterized protein n=1 Tax=Puccinia graminis f. sp. tritici TaxID=56615 RepID=A0A5B0MGY0_PUCGR|nr:hypothetical protein PGT21_028401 [Puccinia graminis f. sp. tritici]
MWLGSRFLIIVLLYSNVPRTLTDTIRFLRLIPTEDTIWLESSVKEPGHWTITPSELEPEELYSALREQAHGPQAIELLIDYAKKNAAVQSAPAFIVADEVYRRQNTWELLDRAGNYRPVDRDLAQLLFTTVLKIFEKREEEIKMRLSRETREQKEMKEKETQKQFVDHSCCFQPCRGVKWFSRKIEKPSSSAPGTQSKHQSAQSL